VHDRTGGVHNIRVPGPHDPKRPRAKKGKLGARCAAVVRGSTPAGTRTVGIQRRANQPARPRNDVGRRLNTSFSKAAAPEKVFLENVLHSTSEDGKTGRDFRWGGLYESALGGRGSTGGALQSAWDRGERNWVRGAGV